MGFVSEFKEFIAKGNVLDLAVGVIIGAAFSKIITSLTEDILLPIIGLATGGVDFKNWFFALDGNSYDTMEKAKAAGAATLNYGLFFNTVIYFFIIAFCLFLIIRFANRFKRPAGAAPTNDPLPTREQILLTEIRDALRGRVNQIARLLLGSAPGARFDNWAKTEERAGSGQGAGNKLPSSPRS